MKRIAFTLCALSILGGAALAGTAPAVAGCAGMTNAQSDTSAPTTTASSTVTRKGG